ncbi:nucleoside diphosphate kinase [Tribonema minus]|uniref:Nucleoside diphosphate kinase n=1 Tax=Tribonema minus TaxID=303371 RepID=A0A835Z9B5_9STRA|nr:nucleoside diphosphate kinase [Tribonema minus]
MKARCLLLLALASLACKAFAKPGDVCNSPFTTTGSGPYTGSPGTLAERSFVAIKPEGLQRGLVGDVITRFERKGLKLVALKLEQPTPAKVRQHYAEHEGKPFFAGLVRHMCSGPLVLMVWEGPNVIEGGRRMLGKTDPLEAEPGTIRGDLCVCSTRNLVHASDAPDSALREIRLWFSEAELAPWGRTSEEYLTGTNSAPQG